MPYNHSQYQQQQALAVLRKERLEREERERAEAEERKRQNDATRSRYLAKLDAERAERRAASEAKLEEELASERGRLMRQWLADHPGKNERDFAAVWPHLRVNVLEERGRAAIERNKASLRASGRYAL